MKTEEVEQRSDMTAGTLPPSSTLEPPPLKLSSGDSPLFTAAITNSALAMSSFGHTTIVSPTTRHPSTMRAGPLTRACSAMMSEPVYRWKTHTPSIKTGSIGPRSAPESESPSLPLEGAQSHPDSLSDSALRLLLLERPQPRLRTPSRSASAQEQGQRANSSASPPLSCSLGIPPNGEPTKYVPATASSAFALNERSARCDRC